MHYTALIYTARHYTALIYTTRHYTKSESGDSHLYRKVASSEGEMWWCTGGLGPHMVVYWWHLVYCILWWCSVYCGGVVV